MFKNVLRRPLWLLVCGVVVLALIPGFLLVLPRLGAHASGGGPGPGGGTPSLSIQPGTVSPGMTMTVIGFNYPTNAIVRVYFQSKANGVVTTVTDSGGYFYANLTLPKTYTKGVRYYVHADSATFSAQVLVTFNKPTITIGGNYNANPTYGNSAFMYGGGFAANEAVQVSFNEGTLGIYKLGTFATDSYGYINTNIQQFPSIPAGVKALLSATGTISKLNASTTVRENAALNTNPGSGPVGTSVQVSGGGFGSYEHIKVTFKGTTVGTPITNKWGAFSSLFQVPTNATLTGFYNDVQAVGSKTGTAASTSFMVTPLVYITPNRGPAGTIIAVTGSHFSPNGFVDFFLYSTTYGGSGGSNGGGQPLGYTYANAKGFFHITFAVPYGLTSGITYYITFVDENSGANTQLKFHAQ